MSAIALQAQATLNRSTRTNSGAVTLLYAVVAILGVLGLGVSLYGSVMMSGLYGVGAISVQGIDPAFFEKMVLVSVMMAAIGTIGFFRSRAA